MNKLERITLYALCAIVLGFVAGCMTPAAQTAELNRINRAYESGRITRDQAERMSEEVYGQGGIALWHFLLGLVGVGVGTYKAVQIRRGPVATSAERVARKAAPAK